MYWNDSDLARYWPKVDQTGVCHLWTGSRQNRERGYGFFTLNGDVVLAHRLAYEIANGPHSADGWFVLHNCPGRDNPLCVNPAHLWRGTAKENSQDAVTKGTIASGERQGTYTHPESRSYGLNNGAYTHPEKRPRGETHGLVKHPEKAARGETHGSRTKPEQMPKGERHGMARLTATQVTEIRQRAIHETQRSLAHEYGVTETCISSIVLRRTWKTLP